MRCQYYGKRGGFGLPLGLLKGVFIRKRCDWCSGCLKFLDSLNTGNSQESPQLRTSAKVFLGEHTTLLSFRPEQSLWERHGCTRGSTDASELLPAAPPGPHWSVQSSRTQPNHGKQPSPRVYECFWGKPTCFASLYYSFCWAHFLSCQNSVFYLSWTDNRKRKPDSINEFIFIKVIGWVMSLFLRSVFLYTRTVLHGVRSRQPPRFGDNYYFWKERTVFTGFNLNV